MPDFKKIILVDFDGVLSDYSSGWQGADIANDPPVPGAIGWLREMLADDRFDVQIYSSRSRQEGGILCMKNWLIEHGMPVEEADRIKFPTEKPAAFLTIDDRAVCFTGVFPTPHAIQHFKPWNKRENLPPWWDIAVDEAGNYGFEVMDVPPDLAGAYGMPVSEGVAHGVVLVKGDFKRRFSITEAALASKDVGAIVRRRVYIAARELDRDIEYAETK